LHRRTAPAQAVLRQLASVYRDQCLIGDALAESTAQADRRGPELEQRLASISAESATPNKRSSATTKPSSEASSHLNAANND
jgi:hypothetical protein